MRLCSIVQEGPLASSLARRGIIPIRSMTARFRSMRERRFGFRPAPPLPGCLKLLALSTAERAVGRVVRRAQDSVAVLPGARGFAWTRAIAQRSWHDAAYGEPCGASAGPRRKEVLVREPRIPIRSSPRPRRSSASLGSARGRSRARGRRGSRTSQAGDSDRLIAQLVDRPFRLSGGVASLMWHPRRNPSLRTVAARR